VQLGELVSASERQLCGPRHGRRCILVVDDSGLGMRLARELEGDRSDILSCGDPLRLIAQLRDEQPGLVLLGERVGNRSALDLCRLIRADASFDNTPLVVLATGVEPFDRADIFRAGAEDYLALPLVHDEWRGRVISRLERHELIRSLQSRDPLTGLFSRAYFEEQLRSAVGEARRHGTRFAVVFLVPTEIEALRRRLGPATVDALLRELGSDVLGHFRRADVCARYGRDDVVVLVHGVDAAACGDRCDRLRQDFARRRFEFAPADFSVALTASIAAYPGDAGTAEQLVAVARQPLG
jgi:diguanylate cyclase (GGDEF)-like protein